MQICSTSSSFKFKEKLRLNTFFIYNVLWNYTLLRELFGVLIVYVADSSSSDALGHIQACTEAAIDLLLRGCCILLRGQSKRQSSRLWRNGHLWDDTKELRLEEKMKNMQSSNRADQSREPGFR